MCKTYWIFFKTLVLEKQTNSHYLCSTGFDPGYIQLTVTNLPEGPNLQASFQLLLYSNESLIHSICASAVMLTVHFKGSLQMKASLPFPPLPISVPLSVRLREIWGLSL